MNSKSIGADLAYAWPSAELAVMGPEGAVEIVYRRDLAEAADPVGRRKELVEEYTERYANPYAAAERGLCRRRHRPGRDPPGAGEEPGPAGLQARGPAQAQAREHAAVTVRPTATRPAGPASAPGIAVRPEVDPEVLAVLAAAVDQAWPRPRLVRRRGAGHAAGVAVQRAMVVEAGLGPPRRPWA